jgi:hypothetical protein
VSNQALAMHCLAADGRAREQTGKRLHARHITLTGQRPKPAAEADEPADDQRTPPPKDSEDAA